MNTNDIYTRITDIIIEMLENHKKSNYSQSWYNLSGDSIFAKNIISNHTYSGINQLLLNYLKTKYGYSYNRWMTFKQLNNLGGKIQKGSKAALVVYKSHLYLDKETGKNITKYILSLLKKGQSIEHINYQKRGYLKNYSVFNVSQIENLPDEYYKIEEVENLTEFERDEQAEHLINCTGAKINFSAQNSAYYNILEDEIYMPLAKQFVSKDAYYSIISHEISHWSGASSRLNREIDNEFGSQKYGFEELISEVSSAFICATLGYESRITNNVDYINNWLSIMKNDTKFIIQASSQAQKASNYILEFAKIKELETV